jgi:hypothetical protein
MGEDLKQVLQSLASILEKLGKDRSSKRASSLTNVTSLLGTFSYDPERDQTFPQWFERNSGILESCVESSTLKAQVSLKALGPNEYGPLRCSVSPESPESLPFEDLVSNLCNLFGPTKSLFRRRCEILEQRAKRPWRRS